MRCSGSSGPILRMKRAARLLTARRSSRRTERSSTDTSAPAALSTTGRNAVIKRRRMRRAPLMAGGAFSKIDDDLAEDLPAFQPFETLLYVFECKFAVDRRREPVCHLGEARADIAQG